MTGEIKVTVASYSEALPTRRMSRLSPNPSPAMLHDDYAPGRQEAGRGWRAVSWFGHRMSGP